MKSMRLPLILKWNIHVIEVCNSVSRLYNESTANLVNIVIPVYRVSPVGFAFIIFSVYPSLTNLLLEMKLVTHNYGNNQHWFQRQQPNYTLSNLKYMRVCVYVRFDNYIFCRLDIIQDTSNVHTVFTHLPVLIFIQRPILFFTNKAKEAITQKETLNQR